MTKTLLHTDGVVLASFRVRSLNSESEDIIVSQYAGDVSRDIDKTLRNLKDTACIVYMRHQGIITSGEDYESGRIKDDKENYKIWAKLQDYDISYTMTRSGERIKGKEKFQYKRKRYAGKYYIQIYKDDKIYVPYTAEIDKKDKKKYYDSIGYRYKYGFKWSNKNTFSNTKTLIDDEDIKG